MNIRGLRPADEPRVVEIALAAWTPVYVGYEKAMGPEIFAFYRPNWRERKTVEILEACRGQEGYIGHVVEIDGVVAAFITYRLTPDGRGGVIGNNAVDPQFQGRGIAQTMCRFALDELRRKGAQFVSVLTGGDDAHVPARKVYEKAGFHAGLPSVTYHLKLS